MFDMTPGRTWSALVLTALLALGMASCSGGKDAPAPHAETASSDVSTAVKDVHKTPQAATAKHSAFDKLMARAKSDAHAKNDPLGSAKGVFTQALLKADMGKVQRLWDKMDASSRAVSLGTPRNQSAILAAITQQNPGAFEQTARFLGAVNQADPQYRRTEQYSRADKTVSVTGTVRNISNNKALPGVTIVVAGTQAISDENGNFSLTNMPAGRYSAVLYTSASAGAKIWPVLVATGRPWDLLYDGPPRPKAPAGTGTLTLHVVDAQTSAPVAGASIVLAYNNGQPLDSVVKSSARGTDANGDIIFTRMPTGNFQLTIIQQNGLFYRPEVRKATMKQGGKIEATIRLKKLQGALEVPAATLAGTVLRADTGAPVAGVHVSVDKGAWAPSDDAGHFSLAMPSTGGKISVDDLRGMKNLDDLAKLAEARSGAGAAPFVLQASHKDYEAFSKEYSITFTPGEASTVVVHLTPLPFGDIDGIIVDAVSGKPIAGANVQTADQSAPSAEDGSFLLHKVHSGSVTVAADAKIYHSGTAEIDLKPLSKASVTIKLNPVTTGGLQGQVLNAADGAPLAGARVSAGGQSATSDAQGRFKIAQIDAGQLTVGAQKPVFKPASKDIEISPAQTAALTLRLEPVTTGTLKGVVLNAATGKPLAGASVSLGKHSRSTGEDGAFEFADIPAGAVSVEAAKAVFTPASASATIKAAQTVSIRLHLKPVTTGAISGVVQDADSRKPLKGAVVHIGTHQSKTDSAGRFAFTDIDIGKASIEAQKSLYVAASEEVEIKAAQAVQTVLSLKAITTGTIHGQVVDAVSNKPLSGSTISVGGTSVQTGADGHYQLAKIDAGKISIDAAKPVYEGASTRLTLKPGANAEVSFRLQPVTSATFSGTVVNATTRKPLPGTTILLATQSVSTDKKGHFEITRTATGKLVAHAQKTGFSAQDFAITLKPAQRASHGFALEPITTATITGTVQDKVTGKPVARVRVSAGERSGDTAANGAFVLKDVALGRVSLLARHPDYKDGSRILKLKAGQDYNETLKLERRREDVTELEKALRDKGSVDLYGIHFDSGKDQFRPESLSTLQAVSAVIKSASGQVFEIAGHTDSDGADAYNQDLSRRRAQTVIAWLVDHDVDAGQLKARGYGETRPVAPNASAAGKALNRRVQLKKLR